MTVADDRVARADFIIPVDGTAPRHHDTVIGKGTALGDDQIIPAVVFVDMGSFDPFAAGLQAVPDHCALSLELKRFRVKLTQIDPMMSLVNRIRDDVIARIIHFSVIVKEKTGIDTVCTLHKAGLAPRSRRILRGDDIVISPCLAPFGDKRVDDIEQSVMITDRRRPQSERSLAVLVIQLLRRVDSVSDLLPVHQILTVEDRKARKINERGSHHVVVFPDPADGRIRIKTAFQRILESFLIH